MIRGAKIQLEKVKYWADFQTNWASVIPALKRSRYLVLDTSSLSIHGDAPKCFLLVKEFTPGQVRRRPSSWSKYIAKVGSKWYPIESITEHLITRIGQICNFRMADSRLRFVGPQVRYLSRFFLSKNESLVHGIEMFRDDFGEDLVEEIARKRLETEFYTFSTVVKCVSKAYPDEGDEIMDALFRMLVFDALIGNNDRHPANWGVVTSVKARVRARFSPIFDSARGLFWNIAEDRIKNWISDANALDAYVKRSRPQIGWEGHKKLNHFELVRLIQGHDMRYRNLVEECVAGVRLDDCRHMLSDEFGRLLSRERLALIEQCLENRLQSLKAIIGS